ncbi:hypothetical protein [Pelosinus sp. IPA-1]|uniref:hypothetical protein n=1 Tax=Pelosinus sp. IPA-1 TaxID=3029569 RepID=UPI002555204A|nr:hypothetical protein [Pelosinus sp. IPA-1]
MAFNCQQFADLLHLALGDRSINKYGNDSDVDPGYISRLMRCKTKRPPSADIIKKLANKAYNDVTAEQFQKAAGYLNSTEDAPVPQQYSADEQALIEKYRRMKEHEKDTMHKVADTIAPADEQAATFAKGC